MERDTGTDLVPVSPKKAKKKYRTVDTNMADGNYLFTAVVVLHLFYTTSVATDQFMAAPYQKKMNRERNIHYD